MIGLVAIGVAATFSFVFAIVAWKQQFEDRRREGLELADVERALRRHFAPQSAPVEVAKLDGSILGSMTPENDRQVQRARPTANRRNVAADPRSQSRKSVGAGGRRVA
jgi:hypothetical protein